MIPPLKKWFAAPIFPEDEDKTHRAALLNIFNWVILAVIGVYSVQTAWYYPDDYISWTLIGVMVGICILTGLLIRQGKVTLAGWIFSAALWSIFAAISWFFGGIQKSNTNLPTFIIVFLIAGLILNRRAVVTYLVLSILLGFGLVQAELNGLLDLTDFRESLYETLFYHSMTFVIITVLIFVFSGRMSGAVKQARQNERAMAESNRQLQLLQGSLEDQVRVRTQYLETVATLGEKLTAILDRGDLLKEVVDQIEKNFGYYHAHIYLLDKEGESLVVAAGTGQAGAEMVGQGHKISLNAAVSLVAKAARTKQLVQVDNVTEAAEWLPNPLLPDTQAEIAVPIILDGQVVGVLDVQENQVAGLDDGDANLLRLVANQVANGLRNVRQFSELKAALAHAEVIQEQYLTRLWQKTSLSSEVNEYISKRSAAAPIDETRRQIFDKAHEAALEQKTAPVFTLNDNNSEKPALVGSINLRGKVIGSLQLHPSNESLAWNSDNLAVITAVLDQFAQSVENLRLFDESRERAGREQTIREITDKLRAAPNLDFLLETAARELGRRLEVQHTVLRLGIEKQRQLTEEPK